MVCGRKWQSSAPYEAVDLIPRACFRTSRFASSANRGRSASDPRAHRVASIAQQRRCSPASPDARATKRSGVRTRAASRARRRSLSLMNWSATSEVELVALHAKRDAPRPSPPRCRRAGTRGAVGADAVPALRPSAGDGRRAPEPEVRGGRSSASAAAESVPSGAARGIVLGLDREPRRTVRRPKRCAGGATRLGGRFGARNSHVDRVEVLRRRASRSHAAERRVCRRRGRSSSGVEEQSA